MEVSACGTDQIGTWLYDDVEIVRRAEELGYDTIWGSEGQGKTAFGKLERWATETENVSLGTGIVNVYSRTPATIAQAITTLDEHADGRAMLGLGVAHPGVVETFHGLEFDRPLARMVEYITLIRRYLERDETPYDGEFVSPGRTSFWEGFDGRSTLPIYNAAIGEENIRLTGEYADGWLPNVYPLDAVPDALEWLAEGARRANRDPNDIDVAMYIPTAVSDDPEEAYRAVARSLVRYLWGEIPGFYDRVARDAGYEEEVRAIQDASTPEEAAERMDDGVVDVFAVAGTPETAREKFAAYREAGVNHPIVRPAGEGEIIKQTLEALAPIE